MPLADTEPTSILAALKRRVTCPAREGNLRLAVHFYNDEDDIDRLTAPLAQL